MFLLNLFIFAWLKKQQLLSSISIFSGVQENESEFIDISKLALPYPASRSIRETFVRSGFADDSVGYYKLLPCPLGTFADSFQTHPRCKNCPAGKL